MSLSQTWGQKKWSWMFSPSLWKARIGQLSGPEMSPPQPPAPGAIRNELLTRAGHTPCLHRTPWQAGGGLLSQRARARRLNYRGVHFRPSRYYQLLTFSCWVGGRLLPFLPLPHPWGCPFRGSLGCPGEHVLPWGRPPAARPLGPAGTSPACAQRAPALASRSQPRLTLT